MQHSRLSMILTAVTVAAGLAVSSAPNATASTVSEAHGAVFVQTDDSAHNAVIAYDRAADGHLRGQEPTSPAVRAPPKPAPWSTRWLPRAR